MFRTLPLPLRGCATPAAALCALLAAAFAPTGADGQEVRDIRFRAAVWSGTVNDLKLADSDGDARGITLRSESFGDWQRYRGPAPVRFFRESAAGDEEREKRVTVGTFDPPADSSQFLLVFIPAGKAKDGGPRYEILGVAADLPSFPPEYVKIWNFTDTRMHSRLNEEVHVIDAKASKLLYEEAEGPGEDASDLAFGRNLDVLMAARLEGYWRQIYRSRWSISEDNRMLVFIYPRDGRPPRVKAIKEFIRDQEER